MSMSGIHSVGYRNQNNQKHQLQAGVYYLRWKLVFVIVLISATLGLYRKHDTRQQAGPVKTLERV